MVPIWHANQGIDEVAGLSDWSDARVRHLQDTARRTSEAVAKLSAGTPADRGRADEPVNADISTRPYRPGCESCRAGIRVSEDFPRLHNHSQNHRYASISIPDLHDVAVEAGAHCGLEYRGERRGLELVESYLDGHSEKQRVIRRQVFYALAPIGREVEAAREMAKCVSVKNGAGAWWSTLGAVHVIEDDGRARVADVEGIPHVLLRAIYFHQPIDPPDEVIDGLTREQCLDRLRARVGAADGLLNPAEIPGWPPGRTIEQELSDGRLALTTAQIAAARELWSAQLRAKTEASRKTDRERDVSVRYCEEDEW